MEREISANWIVRFCQERGDGWAPFLMSELRQFCCKQGYERFSLNGLDKNPAYGIVKQDDVYLIRPRFVARCYGASPAKDAEMSDKDTIDLPCNPGPLGTHLVQAPHRERFAMQFLKSWREWIATIKKRDFHGDSWGARQDSDHGGGW